MSTLFGIIAALIAIGFDPKNASHTRVYSACLPPPLPLKKVKVSDEKNADSEYDFESGE